MPDDMNCLTCAKSREELGRKCMRYIKRLCATLPNSNIILGDVLRRIGFPTGKKKNWSGKFCCSKCWGMVQRFESAEKKLMILHEDWRTQTGHSLPMIPRRRIKEGFKTRAISLIEKSKYSHAFRAVKQSKSARESFRKCLKRDIHKEMRVLQKDETLLPSGQKWIDFPKYDWQGYVDNVQRVAPTLVSSLKAALSSSCKRRECKRFKQELNAARLSTMIMISLHNRHPKRHRILQLSVARTLIQGGCQLKVNDCLRRLGITVNRRALQHFKGKSSEELDQDDVLQGSENEIVLMEGNENSVDELLQPSSGAADPSSAPNSHGWETDPSSSSSISSASSSPSVVDYYGANSSPVSSNASPASSNASSPSPPP